MASLETVAPRSEAFVDWSDAYQRVEEYFCALQVRDRLLLSQLVAKVLSRAEKQYAELGMSPAELAMVEANKIVHSWFSDVFEAAGGGGDVTGVRGRLALFLADMPNRWQREFLHEGPWPEPFLEAMRATYLKTGPEFREARMRVRPIDLGPVSAVADETWKAFDRWPVLGALAVWSLYLGVAGCFVYLLR